jgi:hypothetical protein
MPESAPRRPWWCRLRISLSVRVLMVLVLAIGGGLGWLGYRARVQREAGAAIERAGGHVLYEWDAELGLANGLFEYTTSAPEPPRPPEWLLNLLGPDYLGSITDVFWEANATVNDDLLAHVGRLRRVERLTMRGGESVTEAGLVHLENLKRIKELEISVPLLRGLRHLKGASQLEVLRVGCGYWTDNVTDKDAANFAGLSHIKKLVLLGNLTRAGLVHLQGMSQLSHLRISSPELDSLEPLAHLTELEWLDLHGTGITDAGLAPVAGFHKLKFLRLNGTRVGDAGLAHLRHLPLLKTLYLGGAAVGDAGLAYLGHLPMLEVLSLDNTAVGDAGLAHINQLPKLSYLSLDGTRMGDKGIAHLAKLPELRELSMENTSNTSEGLRQLVKFPRLETVSFTPTWQNRDGITTLVVLRPKLKINN